MKQVLIKRGDVIADDVPAPACESGTVLVAVLRSCISVGTELSGLKRSGLPPSRTRPRSSRRSRACVCHRSIR